MAAADAGGLHPAVGGEVGRAEGQALHARAGRADLLDVGHAARGLEDRVDQDRPVEAGLGLELGEQPVDVVDVLGALHLRHHDHVELVADLGHERGEVVEHPRAVERVDPGPELRRPEVGGLADVDQALAGLLLVLRLDRVLEVAEQHVDGADHAGHLGGHLLVAGVEEVDRAARPGRDVAQRRGSPDGERGEEVLGGTCHGAQTTAARASRRYDGCLAASSAGRASETTRTASAGAARGGRPGSALRLDPGRTPVAPGGDLGVDVALVGDHRRPDGPAAGV